VSSFPIQILFATFINSRNLPWVIFIKKRRYSCKGVISIRFSLCLKIRNTLCKRKLFHEDRRETWKISMKLPGTSRAHQKRALCQEELCTYIHTYIHIYFFIHCFIGYVMTQSVKRTIQRGKFDCVINIKLERRCKNCCDDAGGGAGTVQNTRKEILPLSHS
jgi:hypothetical protein